MTLYRDLVEREAAALGLDPDLVEAIVWVESSGLTDAFRFEPGFWRRYLAAKPEYAGQNPRRVSSSYGLMQVMYPTAQEHGFGWPPERLFEPEVGLRYGCLHLRALLEWANGEVDKALGAYNAGRGRWDSQAGRLYASKVNATLARIRAARAG